LLEGYVKKRSFFFLVIGLIKLCIGVSFERMSF